MHTGLLMKLMTGQNRVSWLSVSHFNCTVQSSNTMWKCWRRCMSVISYFILQISYIYCRMLAAKISHHFHHALNSVRLGTITVYVTVAWLTQLRTVHKGKNIVAYPAVCFYSTLQLASPDTRQHTGRRHSPASTRNEYVNSLEKHFSFKTEKLSKTLS
jgi:hypothetical protein